MPSFPESMQEYHHLLQQGSVQAAYRGLVEYMMGLRTHFQKRYPDHFVSGSLYAGVMDMTYFAFTPPALKPRGLKVAVVFVHEAFRFEVWLAGANKQVQNEYWKRFKASGSGRYRLVPTTQGADSILEHVLADAPDFRDLEALTRQIEEGTLEFIRRVEELLADSF